MADIGAAWEHTLPRQHGPRYRLTYPGPGHKCVCGHREGTHNDLSYCTVFNCGCREAGGFQSADTKPSNS